MPKNEIAGLPFPPLVKIDIDDPLEIETVTQLLLERQEGVSLCIRSAEGHINRGGYFFHIHPNDLTLEKCDIYNFEKIYVASLPLNKLVIFINHCAGLEFDEEAFQFCQTVVNFRLDPAPISSESA